MAREARIRLKHLFDRITPGSLVLYPILAVLFFVYRIIPKKSDGWRKSTAVFHRKIPSRYIGCIKNLYLPAPVGGGENFDLIVEKLHHVFSNFKTTHHAVNWKRWFAPRMMWEFVDFLKVELSDQLVRLKFFPDKNFPINELQDPLIAYFESQIAVMLPDINSIPPGNWSFKLEKKLVKMAGDRFREMDPETIELILKRIVSSTWITESGSKEEESVPHSFEKLISPGFGNFYCKLVIRAKEFDLWMQINHISLDGRGAQESMKRIVKSFGQGISPPGDINKISDPIRTREVEIFKQRFDEGITTVDLTVFLDTLAQYESRFGRINPVALMAWCVSLHPAFSNTKFNIPVDIPMTRTKERTVGFVFIRPGYFHKKYEFPISFEKYLSFFNTQFEQVRKRQGANFIFVESASVIHPVILNLFFKIFPNSLEELIGGTCLTLMKGIDTALPPLSDNISSGIIFSFSTDPTIKISNIGVRSFNLDSPQYLSHLGELFSDLDHYLHH